MALVVTIIVLLILAGVAINLTIGDNGIFTRAGDAVVINENAAVYEQLQMTIADYQIDDIEIKSAEEYLKRLKSDGYINEQNIVNVTNLMKRNMQTGNGSKETGDVYIIEQMQKTASSTTSDNAEDMNYYLIYYEKNNESNRNLGLAFDGNIKSGLEATEEKWFEYDDATGAIAIVDSDDYYSFGIKERNLGIKTIIVPETYQGKKVTSIGIRYMWNAYALMMGINLSDVEKIVLPNNITKINDGFSDEPMTERNIKTGAFSECISLKEIELSDNLIEIGKFAFYNCTSLEKIEIPEKVERIGGKAFYNCDSLREVVIPESVTTIESEIFEECDNLKKITLLGKVFTREQLGVDDSVEIIYTGFLDFAEKYLANKEQQDLEELILKSSGYIGSFDAFLEENGTTRENIENIAKESGKSYIEFIKDWLISPESWVYVEFVTHIEGLDKMSIEELENMFAQKVGAQDFEDFLTEIEMSKEEFLSGIANNEGFTEEIDFLKYYIVFH